MNNRNELDKRNEVNFLEYLRPLFYLAVVAVIVGGVATVQCSDAKEQPKPNIRVPYNPTYTKPEIADSTKHDCGNDTLLSGRKIETLNEILAR